MSQGQERDLQVDAVPLSPNSSGLSSAEPAIQMSQAGVAFSRNVGASSRPGSTAAPQSASGQQCGSSSQSQASDSGVQAPVSDLSSQALAEEASSQLDHRPAKQELPSDTLPAGITPHVPIPRRQSDESSDSLREDVLKGVNKAVSQRLGDSICPDSGFKSLTVSSLPSSASSSGVTDEDIEKYRNKFPPDLKTDYYDAMIIYMKDYDELEVEQFLKRVRTEVLLNKTIKPKVILFDEIFPNAGMNPIAQLDESLKFCTYVFLYVTKSFCEDGWTEFSSQTCLMDAILTPDKKWSVVPIFTEPKRRPTYRVPPSVRSLKGIQYWSVDKFYADSLRKLLEDKLDVRLKREAEQKHQRILWIIHKRTEEEFEEKKKEQEVLFKRREEELKKKMQDMAMKESERRHAQRICLPSKDEFQKLTREYAPQQSVSDDYMKDLLARHASMPSYTGSSSMHLSTSSSEPSKLSELAKSLDPADPSYRLSPCDPAGGHYGRYPPGPGYSGYHPGYHFAHDLGTMHGIHQHPSDPGLSSSHGPHHSGYGGVHGSPVSGYGSMLGYHDPHGHPTSQILHRYPLGQAGRGDSMPPAWAPLSTGSYHGPHSTSPGQSWSAHQNRFTSVPGTSPGGGYPRQGGQGTGQLGPKVVRSGNLHGPGGDFTNVQCSSPDEGGGEVGNEKGSSPLAGLAFPNQGRAEEFSEARAAGSQSGRSLGGQKSHQTELDKEGGPHSLPADVNQSEGLHQNQDNISVSKMKPGFGSLPSQLNTSSHQPPTAPAESARLVGSGVSGSSTKTADTSSQEELAFAKDESLPPKDDLEEDQPPSYESSPSYAVGDVPYDPRHLQYTEVKGTGRRLVSGGVAEHVMYTHGAGHHSDSRTMASQDVRGGYTHRHDPHEYEYPRGGYNRHSPHRYEDAQGAYTHNRSPPRYGYEYTRMPNQPYHGLPAHGAYMPRPGYLPYMPTPMPYHPYYGPSPPLFAPPPPQPVYPEQPQPQVHIHQHYHDGEHDRERERGRPPQNINIGKVENVMMGENIAYNVEKSRKKRSQISVAPPEFEDEAPELYLREPGSEQHLPGGQEMEESIEMVPRGGSSPHTLQNPGSRLTEMVTPDQSRILSTACPSNAQLPEPPQSNQYGYRDLPTVSGLHQPEPPTLPSGTTALVRPVGRAAPMVQSQWRQNYDEENDTDPKQFARDNDRRQAGGDNEETFAKSE
ncbi:hypothetical protein BaRGS_00028753 [Batillaria attramentaria]|uniref:TIR domain-containing protein n=1 Tax=Batillaria attramentaria TaxID=370345 RepID=A0ABD0JY04_9CAEN